MIFPKSLSSLSDFSRWWPNRIHRKLDARDMLLAEAMTVLEEKSASVYPEVTSSVSSVSLGAGALTGKVIGGVNFIGDATKSSGATANSTGQVSFTAVRPGEQTITVTITDTGVALAVSANVAAGTITIVHGSGGPSTGSAIASAVNAHAAAKFMVLASGSVDVIDEDESVSVEGGVGQLLTLSVGGVSFAGATAGCGITQVTNTAITYNIAAGTAGFTAGNAYAVALRVDGVKVEVPPIAVVA